MNNFNRLRNAGPILTSRSISDGEIANPNPIVQRIGHRKPYSLEQMPAPKDPVPKEGNNEAEAN